MTTVNITPEKHSISKHKEPDNRIVDSKRFIKFLEYHNHDKDNALLFKLDSNRLELKSLSQCKATLLESSYSNFTIDGMEEGEIALYSLKELLDILKGLKSQFITFKYLEENLIIYDASDVSVYSIIPCTESSIVPKVPELKYFPSESIMEFELSTELIEKLNSKKSILKKYEFFCFKRINNESMLINFLNCPDSKLSSFNFKVDCDFFDEIVPDEHLSYFSTEKLLNLIRNSENNISFILTAEGISKILLDNPQYSITGYLIAKTV